MERPLLSGFGFSLGDRNPDPAQDRHVGKRQNSSRVGKLGFEDGYENVPSVTEQSPNSDYPQSLDETDLVETISGEDNLGTVVEARTVQSQQNHSLRQSMIKQEKNAQYIVRAPHSDQGNTINLQVDTTPRFRLQNQRY